MSDGVGLVRRWAAGALFTVVIVTAAGLIVWAIPRTLSFVPGAPQGFWAIAVLALIAEAPLFVFARRRQASSPTTLSVCFTFGIFLAWGVAPAVIVQTLAIAIRALGQRLRPSRAAFLTGRLVLALAASEVALLAFGARPEPGSGQLDQGAADYLLHALIWFIVNFGLVVLAQLALGLGRVGSLNAALREDILGTAALLLLVPPVLVELKGWSSALVLLPLLAWNQLSRTIARRQETLSREPTAGALNRRGLQERFDQLVAGDATNLRASGATGLLLVTSQLIYDIRRDLGPEIFDQLSVEGARRLASSFGEDRVGIISGEGFVVLLTRTSPPAAVDTASTVKALMAEPMIIDGVPFVVDPVVGVATATSGQATDFDSLVVQAQQAATHARDQGQLVGVYVPETFAGLRRRRELLTDLNSMLGDPNRHHEIAMHYQPQVDIDTGRLVGVEALLRWNHPSWGPIPPAELINAVETSQVMSALTAHVINRVASQLNAWRQSGFCPRASVNVSILDLYDATFPTVVGQVLEAQQLPADQLTIEITETALLTEPDRVAQAAAALRAVGVGLSLDDFGTGYASLQQLRRLPLTEVKLDKSYVDKVASERSEWGIVASTHAYAQALGLGLVAEGIDNADTLDALGRLPGTVGQGYFIGRPMTVGDLDRWRAEHNHATRSTA